MNTAIYKGNKQQGSYLYLIQEGDFSQVPEILLATMGKLELVMNLGLHTEEGIEITLAQADVRQVIKALEQEGFYLQIQQNEAEKLLLANKLPASHFIPKL